MSPHVTGTTPYPWPFDGDLRGAATALLVVVAADGVLPASVAGRVAVLAAAVRGAGGPVLAVATTAPPPGAAVPAGGGAAAPPPTPDVLGDLVPDVALAAGGVDGFYASDLDMVLRLRGLRRLLVVGVGLETCVHSTMRDANDRGYECLLVVDACEPVDAALVAASVSSVEMSGGIFGAVGTTRAVVAALTTLAPPAATPPAVPVTAGSGSVPTSGDLP